MLLYQVECEMANGNIRLCYEPMQSGLLVRNE